MVPLRRYHSRLNMSQRARQGQLFSMVSAVVSALSSLNNGLNIYADENLGETFSPKFLLVRVFISIREKQGGWGGGILFSGV